MMSFRHAFALRSVATAAALILATACSDANPVGPDDGSLARGGNPNAGNPDQPAGKFVVMLDDRVDPAAVVRDHELQAEQTFTQVFKGFSGSISEAARSGLLQDARVRGVDKVQEVSVTGSGVVAAGSWGLDRVDQRTSDFDGLYHYSATGAGVTVYVVDTGIRYSHVDFGGRARFGFDAFGGNGSDCYGHGTHVAGTVGGTVYGVAKEVELVSVRVLPCDGVGSTETVVAGLEWIAQNAQRPAVVNMSLIADADDVIDAAVRSLIAQGITVVAAAGNAWTDACWYSPARVPEALTVGSTTVLDQRAPDSNYGSCVDWYAPGEGIWSASPLNDSDGWQMRGTSAAAPHGAGAAALFLEPNPWASPSHVATGISLMLSTDAVDLRLKGNHSRGDLLYTVGAPITGNLAPLADFTFSCDELACSFEDRSTDVDGSVVSWSWDFGSGNTSADRRPSFVFPAAGTYAVSLTVTDDQGGSASTTRSVSVSPRPEGIQLQAFGYKVKGSHRVDLVWTGSIAQRVDVYRDGQRVASAVNTGTFTDAPDAKGKATYTYRVCEAQTEVCSTDVTVAP